MAEWSDLPFDVLEHLTNFLSLPDYHRFSAVCQNWCTAAKQRRHSPAKQLPWLLVRGESDLHKRRVFSISENRHYNIDLPELQGQYVCGSSYGWLLTMDIDLNLKLLNPLTGKHYDLPLLPLSDLMKSRVRESIGYRRGITREYVQTRFVYKAILDHDPARRSDFTLLILKGLLRREIYFWRPGNLVWTSIDERYSFEDISYFKGKFFAYDYTEIAGDDTHLIYVVDVGPNPKVTHVAPEVPFCDDYEDFGTYLVDFREELLLVMWINATKMDHAVTREILVYKLDLEEGKYFRRHHLDGYSIFLGNNLSLVVDPSQFSSCKENCIYFANTSNPDNNRIFDMLKGTVSPYYPPEIFHPQIVDPIWWTPNPW